ncbi:MAG: hypothetical protein IJY85_03800 [Ruminococcus sp.]|nr:hypothetical protein [Ruminococcus sp.]
MADFLEIIVEAIMDFFAEIIMDRTRQSRHKHLIRGIFFGLILGPIIALLIYLGITNLREHGPLLAAVIFLIALGLVIAWFQVTFRAK